ncbi:MAG: 4Fe-4S dicluster domain-containing protein [Candidatus Aminicenantaceae bacterium]
MIRVALSRCTGCRRCEAACAFFHTGRINPELARLRVVHLYEIGVDGPVVCQQCEERYCMACPEDALSLGDNGEVICSPTACTLCGACEKACPIGAVTQFQGFVYICDLCGGDPKCVKACTEGAIVFEEGERPSFEKIRKLTRGMNPQERRHSYLSRLGRNLREEWETRSKSGEGRDLDQT